jgi:hypothetical protein
MNEWIDERECVKRMKEVLPSVVSSPLANDLPASSPNALQQKVRFIIE